MKYYTNAFQYDGNLNPHATAILHQMGETPAKHAFYEGCAQTEFVTIEVVGERMHVNCMEMGI